MSDPTDPAQYGNRGVLVLAQLFHVNGITGPEKLKASPDKLVADIIRDWTGHVSFRLEEHDVGLATRDELQKLYEGLLVRYKVETTVDLANSAYYQRIDELEADMVGHRAEFRKVLDGA
ncbi:uncharacterized protein CANTADRAFT_49229 [Suhomyces tanzawaensis NRRL Y-17324]|uniref:Uncharacterized protein n=1 Tax=Suhomyces tanzawaensis NRRL Y-17324 TaxID=984487 RepID=A0A1E4SL24_9ASCO|nr:uncharacterized protein CANTADRAFT_49229 [Suhomyces tanzawaensis NRRL Y-17324]ODV80204.1 hypothetical protein CANTADRAFT_49229 [Suhomyces tanzawaensis NRRL Y-17324]